MAANDVSQVCYNHPDKKADFKCFDCKLDSIINVCAQCNIQVHSLDVFRAHRVEQLVIKDRERRLSQDINDIEKLIAVERDLLKNVLIRLKYCQQEEKETLSHLIQLQTATKRRLVEIKECEEKIDKAFSYLSKVSTMLTQCASPLETKDDNGIVNETSAPVFSEAQTKNLDHVDQAPTVPQQTLVPLAQEPLVEAQNGPLEEQAFGLPDEIKGKDMFPVTVVGSLTKNGSFWLEKIGKADLEKRSQIQAGIRSYFQTYGYRGNVDISAGALCTTLNRFNKEFCRVRIESVASSGMVKLRFVDFGIVEEVSRSSLCPLPKEFVDIPFQAIECCLLPDLDTQLPYEAKWCFKDLTFNKILMAALEGEVTDKKGHTVNQVILASCGEVPVCINTKVANLVEEQRFAQENRPLQPKGDAPEQATRISPKEPPSSDVLGAKTESIVVPHEEKSDTSRKDTNVDLVEDAVAPAFDGSGILQPSNGSIPLLRADAAEFIPTSPENTSKSRVSFRPVPDQSSKVPGILPLSLLENTPGSTKPDVQNSGALSDSQSPPGCVDFEEYNRIVSQCAANTISVETLPKARFFMIRASTQGIIEGMKCGSWYWSHENNKRFSRIYHEQSRIGAPLFLVFSETRSSNFCGVAQMLSPITALTKPSLFAKNMTGKCTIKWIYVHDLLFSDALASNNYGFSKWYFTDFVNGNEIANKLGQLVLKVYDSGSKFRSILQAAVESYQSSLLDQQNNEPVNSVMNYKPCEPRERFPLSQKEDWDLEIEESLKAAKTLEMEATIVSPGGNEPVASSDEPVSEGTSPVEGLGFVGDTTHAVNDGSAHLSDLTNESVSASGGAVQEEELNTVSSQEEVSSSQTSEGPEVSQDKVSAELPFEASVVSVVEFENTPEGYQEQNAEMSPSEPDSKDGKVDILNTSDWEIPSPVKYSALDVTSCKVEEESSEPKQTADDVKRGNQSLTDVHQASSSSDPNSENRGANGSDSGSEAVVDVLGSSSDENLQGNEAPQKGAFNVGCTDANNVEQPESTGDGDNSIASGEIGVSESSKLECNDSGIDGNKEDIDTQEDIQHSPDDLSDEKHASLTENTDADHQGSSEDLLNDDEDISPLEIGKEHYVISMENLSNCGTFWARVHRTKAEEKSFVSAMTRMGDRIESKRQILDDIHIFKPCAIKGFDGYWYRAHIETTLDKGKVGIRLLDLGEYWNVHQNELNVLDDEFYVAPPAQAFECSVCYKHSGNMKEKSKISRVVRKNKKIRVLVKSYSEGTVAVEILS